MDFRNLYTFSQLILLGAPVAQATLRGTAAAPELTGTVQFYRAGEGTQVVAELFGLPSAVRVGGQKETAGPFYAFHIHEGGLGVEPLEAGPLGGAGLHYNPHGAPHPLHAGDLPPLLGNAGYAYMSCYTGRFSPDQVIGKEAVVHQRPDDFRTQPGGDGGLRIGVGDIVGN